MGFQNPIRAFKMSAEGVKPRREDMNSKFNTADIGQLAFRPRPLRHLSPIKIKTSQQLPSFKKILAQEDCFFILL
ncbi:hypothetical protein BCIN_13g02280 [Botrytis cinerea B05.10]|uniref:Uncharacterized protein n=1 Tax=Botryotinia fuckeliana (strain B05.10) TaxID=332648 RepID=A0A384K0K7_BOTFB|nr:hypothetical protein BCIN_13g02280 [Botrytis cinerea B05.10]ATZ56389.1 hypothetical protein BCIN_13g02280 [Botrytis cinerea B05.10]